MRNSNDDNLPDAKFIAHPNQQEYFYLRILLHEVQDPVSFEDLRKDDGIG